MGKIRVKIYEKSKMDIQEDIKKLEIDCNSTHERGTFDFDYIKSDTIKSDVEKLLNRIDAILDNTNCENN